MFFPHHLFLSFTEDDPSYSTLELGAYVQKELGIPEMGAALVLLVFLLPARGFQGADRRHTTFSQSMT